MRLVNQVRDGSMALEDEDYLIAEIVNVVRAYEAHDRTVFWLPPDMMEAVGEGYQTGYEVKFMAETGQPVGMPTTASEDHIEPLYTKRIPRGPFPSLRYPCPLFPATTEAREYQKMGFPPCQSSGTLNFADWDEHLRRVHPGFLVSIMALNAESTEKAMHRLWKTATEDRERIQRTRRAQDPRLVPVGPAPLQASDEA